MQSSTPQLNLNWGLSPQQAETLSVTKGIEKVTGAVDEMVRRKVEEDRQYDQQLNELLRNTTGRYQEELFKMIEEGKGKIKEVGNVNWNSKDLRVARQEVLNKLTSSSQKANWVAQNAPLIRQYIKQDKNIYQDAANQALTEELSKPVDQIDISRIESIPNSIEYKNMLAVIRDAADSYFGDDTFKSDPYTIRQNGMLTTIQNLYKKNYKVKGVEKGVPVMESTMNDDEVKNILKMTGNYDSAFEYFAKKYDSIPNRAIKREDGDASSYEKAVLGLAKDQINYVLSPVEKSVIRSVQDPMVGIGLDYIKKQNTVRVNAQAAAEFKKQGIDELTKALMKGDLTTAAQRIESKVEGAKGLIAIRNYKDLWYKDSQTDEIFNLNNKLQDEEWRTQMIEAGIIKETSKNRFALTEKGKSLNNPFIGIAYQVPKKAGYGTQYVGLTGDIRTEKGARDMATTIVNKTFDKGDIPYMIPEETDMNDTNLTEEEWAAKWQSLSPGQSMIGLDGKKYTKK